MNSPLKGGWVGHGLCARNVEEGSMQVLMLDNTNTYLGTAVSRRVLDTGSLSISQSGSQAVRQSVGSSETGRGGDGSEVCMHACTHIYMPARMYARTHARDDHKKLRRWEW